MRPAALASLAALLAFAGCGGGTQEPTDTAAIPRSVAQRLASDSESISAAMDAGDVCGAAQQADELKHAADEAIAAGEIPAAYQDELEAAVVNLQNTVNCVTEQDEENQGQGQDNGKSKGHDKQEGVTTATDTLTETLTDTTGESD
jgi:hypothetical protein